MAIGERLYFFLTMRGMTQKYLGILPGFPEKSADKGKDTAEQLKMHTVWKAQANKLAAGEISREEYDN